LQQIPVIGRDAHTGGKFSAAQAPKE
jgi:hypothetical protein